jgi:hypothetical protein
MIGHGKDTPLNVINLKNMNEQKTSTPKLLKKGNNMSSPNLQKDKHYLPSRYALDPSKKDSNMQTLLNCNFSLSQPSNLIPENNPDSK